MRRIETAEERVAWFVVLATIPAAIVGASSRTSSTRSLGDPWQIAILLAVFARPPLAERPRGAAPRRMGELGWYGALGVGLAQCLSLAPGISRSGITITASRFLGLDRDSAARLSFLLLVPITFGAVLLKGVKDVAARRPPRREWWARSWSERSRRPPPASWRSAALLGYVRRNTYSVFVVYRLILAAVIVLLILTGVREATF